MDRELSMMWESFLKELEKRSMSQVTYSTWFSRMLPKKIDYDSKSIVITVPSPFIRDYLANNKRHFDLVFEALKEITGIDFDINIISEDEADNVEPTGLANTKFLNASRLNPKYVFDTFVVGKSNEFAHAAALAVSENYDNPQNAFSNPLFIYGGVGLGKTHLMHAIGHFVLDQDPTKKILYVTSEQFTNELINSIQTNKNEEFRNKYRKVDLLLIDDIQFIADKDRTQEEFFHTFNELHEQNKQIVLTSDKPPKDIKSLEERLISRFAWGLVVDIGPPDLETRIAILRNKADSEGFEIDGEVLTFIAENIRSNIRELEGALSRVMAYSKLTSGKISVESAAIVLRDIYETTNKKKITGEYIKSEVAKKYGLTVDDLNSRKRTKQIAYPRQIAMYITRELTDLSLPKIGDVFGGRDHSTVIHAYDKISADLESDPIFKIEITNLIKEIKS
ncbi:chromosomal replication initiator protein DnaA [Peptoniphilus sp. MSJ-1]|uniref:Chromosomal replication initiator protein DnaA n=1 Tax=Peptoniphilus ovalis TaxID=2841503 RepID=A0ABS6FE71_9FIRM|nr:chromosomal replication initiator protein DnaA [Peptoniphilus ovalis]MBU5668470.1 chromosomal replication initiator protein DnaA [Peptoniphilus ovalis]